MEYKLNKGNQSNYEIELTLSEDDIKKFEEKILKDFQKDVQIPGFRKGNVPLEYVKELVKPEYIKTGIYEYAIHTALNKIMNENPDIKFIGNIYDLDIDDKEQNLKIKFKLDIYPDVDVLNNNWEAVKMEKIDNNVSKEEIEQVLNNLANQYSEYKDVDKISENSVLKIKLYFKDKDGNILEEGIAFLGTEDFKEFKILRDNLIGKKKDEEIVLDYSKKDYPPHLQHRDADKNPSTIVIKPVDIKDKIIPEINDEFVKKYFGEEVKDLNELKNKIKEELQKIKYQQGLANAVEEYISKISDSFNIVLPKTIIDEEIKMRLSSLKERFGGEEGFKNYLKSLGESKYKELLNDIKNAAIESLKKIFILKKVVELLNIKDVDWNKPMDVEEKLYKKLVNTEQDKNNK